MYKNGKLQAKRITRKLGEASFDLEVLRDWLFDMDFASVEQWEEALATIEELLGEVSMARDMAVDTVAALKNDPPIQTTGQGNMTAEYMAKNPPPSPTAPETPKDKGKVAK
jgi:hypothetical protein